MKRVESKRKAVSFYIPEKEYFDVVKLIAVLNLCGRKTTFSNYVASCVSRCIDKDLKKAVKDPVLKGFLEECRDEDIPDLV